MTDPADVGDRRSDADGSRDDRASDRGGHDAERLLETVTSNTVVMLDRDGTTSTWPAPDEAIG
jgi:hypothetical protein